MMKRSILFVVVLGLLTIPANPADKGVSKAEMIQGIRTIVESTPNIHPQVTLDLKNFMVRDLASLQEEDFIDLIKTITKFAPHQLTPEQAAYLNKTKALMERKLTSYKAVSPSFTVDANGAFFVDYQNPKFTMVFKDANGKTKTRTYQANINLIGLNIEFTLRLSWIFFLGDINYFDAGKTIELGSGIEVEPLQFLAPLIHNPLIQFLLNVTTNPIITYCPFRNIQNGGLLIVSKPILGLAGGLASLVGGGTLTAVA